MTSNAEAESATLSEVSAQGDGPAAAAEEPAAPATRSSLARRASSAGGSDQPDAPSHGDGQELPTGRSASGAAPPAYSSIQDMIMGIIRHRSGKATLQEIYASCKTNGTILCKRGGTVRNIVDNQHWKSQVRHTLYTSDKFRRCFNNQDLWELVPEGEQQLRQYPGPPAAHRAALAAAASAAYEYGISQQQQAMAAGYSPQDITPQMLLETAGLLQQAALSMMSGQQQGPASASGPSSPAVLMNQAKRLLAAQNNRQAVPPAPINFRGPTITVPQQHPPPAEVSGRYAYRPRELPSAPKAGTGRGTSLKRRHEQLEQVAEEEAAAAAAAGNHVAGGGAGSGKRPLPPRVVVLQQGAAPDAVGTPVAPHPLPQYAMVNELQQQRVLAAPLPNGVVHPRTATAGGAVPVVLPPHAVMHDGTLAHLPMSSVGYVSNGSGGVRPLMIAGAIRPDGSLVALRPLPGGPHGMMGLQLQPPQQQRHQHPSSQPLYVSPQQQQQQHHVHATFAGQGAHSVVTIQGPRHQQQPQLVQLPQQPGAGAGALLSLQQLVQMGALVPATTSAPLLVPPIAAAPASAPVSVAPPPATVAMPVSPSSKTSPVLAAAAAVAGSAAVTTAAVGASPAPLLTAVNTGGPHTAGRAPHSVTGVSVAAHSGAPAQQDSKSSEGVTKLLAALTSAASATTAASAATAAAPPPQPASQPKQA